MLSHYTLFTDRVTMPQAIHPYIQHADPLQRTLNEDLKNIFPIRPVVRQTKKLGCAPSYKPRRTFVLSSSHTVHILNLLTV